MPTPGEKEARAIEDAAASALVRQRDRDRYWSALFAPAGKRPGLLALYAFHAELDRIVDATSEPMAGQIRLQWWRDAIDVAAPGAKTGNLLADALLAAIAGHDLPKDPMIAMVDARMPVMFGDPPPDDRTLKATLRATEGAVFELACAILGDRSQIAREASRQAGVAYGLTDMLAKLPFGAARHRLLLPSSYAASRGVDFAAVERGETTPSFAAAAADLRGVAARAFQQFGAKAPELAAEAWPAFLPLTLIKPHLRAMAAPDFDPLQTVVSINPLRRFWRIWRAARRRSL
ncbi:MAG: squalene/phytoene synthase family protein [Rhodomicrobium sp.]